MKAFLLSSLALVTVAAAQSTVYVVPIRPSQQERQDEAGARALAEDYRQALESERQRAAQAREDGIRRQQAAAEQQRFAQQQAQQRARDEAQRAKEQDQARAEDAGRRELIQAAKELFSIRPTDANAREQLDRWAVSHIAMLDEKTGNSALRSRYNGLDKAVGPLKDKTGSKSQLDLSDFEPVNENGKGIPKDSQPKNR